MFVFYEKKISFEIIEDILIRKKESLILNILYKKLYLGTFFQIIKKDSAPSIIFPS